MIRFKIDSQTTEILDSITKLYNFRKETIIIRISLALSLKWGIRIVEDEKSILQNGREYSPTSNVFGKLINDTDNYQIYKTIFDQYYEKVLTESDFIKILKFHLNASTQRWWSEISSQAITKGEHIDFLIKQINNGLSLRSNMFNFTTTATKIETNIQEYSKPLSFVLGTDFHDNQIEIKINDETQWSSRNIAIAGQNGSGKSQLVLDIIYQLSKNSDHNLPFTFFDFKGTDSEDSLGSFLSSTKCTFLKVNHSKGFPFSPLRNIDFKNQNNILAFANDFQTFFPEIKQVQAASLIRSVQEYINDFNRAPNLSELMESVLEKNSEKDNTTTSVLQQLISSGIYNETDTYEIFNKSTYVSMPSDVSKQVKQFVIFNKLRNMFSLLKSVGNTDVNQNIKALRHVIVIDEAQNFLQKKTARPIIEDMLRELRSIGVIVILIAQETSDFVYPDFDFISQVRLSICADVNDKSSKRMTRFLGSVNSEVSLDSEIKKYSSNEEDLKGNPVKKALINISEPLAIKMRQFWKTVKEEKV